MSPIASLITSSGATTPTIQHCQDIDDINDAIAINIADARLAAGTFGAGHPVASIGATGIEAVIRSGGDATVPNATRASSSPLAVIRDAICGIDIHCAVQDFTQIGSAVSITVGKRLAFIRDSVTITVLRVAAVYVVVVWYTIFIAVHETGALIKKLVAAQVCPIGTDRVARSVATKCGIGDLVPAVTANVVA